ncbi:MAG: hypothetical protein JWM10_731 [Myxococcaceae bacterium]|nr:hypothetical protein [Myxococcaceae bacterium]
MSNRRKVEYASLQRVLMTAEGDKPGVFEELLGFRPSTASFKGVHLMNDLAQTVLGGAPAHGGNFLCKVIRPDADAAERTGEAAMRKDKEFSAPFGRAFPKELGPKRVRALRCAAQLVTNFDGGLYKAGDSMASGLVTHRSLLGFEGFRRLKIGQYLAQTLAEDGRARLRSLFVEDGDPITRALRPLLLDAPLVDKVARADLPAPAAFDLALGRGLSTLLGQGLSKPVALRLLALAASLGVILKVIGVGREGGRPLVLALSPEQEGPVMLLREEAVISLERGFEEFYGAVAARLPAHPEGPGIWQRSKSGGLEFEVTGGLPLEEVAVEILNAARKLAFKSKGDDAQDAADGAGQTERAIYWPERFVYGLGRRTGCVLPRGNKAGWGKRLALTPEHVEALVLMVVPRGETMLWKDFWRVVRDRFGVVVGANASADARELRQSGVPHLNVQHLAANADALLAQAVRRGVARRLPDSGAEVGGTLS